MLADRRASAAISRLVRPVATSRNTSHSRSVSSAGRSGAADRGRAPRRARSGPAPSRSNVARAASSSSAAASWSPSARQARAIADARREPRRRASSELAPAGDRRGAGRRVRRSASSLGEQDRARRAVGDGAQHEVSIAIGERGELVAGRDGRLSTSPAARCTSTAAASTAGRVGGPGLSASMRRIAASAASNVALAAAAARAPGDGFAAQLGGVPGTPQLGLGELAPEAVQLALLVAGEAERRMRRLGQAGGCATRPRRTPPPTRRGPAAPASGARGTARGTGTRSGSAEHHVVQRVGPLGRSPRGRTRRRRPRSRRSRRSRPGSARPRRSSPTPSPRRAASVPWRPDRAPGAPDRERAGRAPAGRRRRTACGDLDDLAGELERGRRLARPELLRGTSGPARTPRAAEAGPASRRGARPGRATHCPERSRRAAAGSTRARTRSAPTARRSPAARQARCASLPGPVAGVVVARRGGRRSPGVRGRRCRATWSGTRASYAARQARRSNASRPSSTAPVTADSLIPGRHARSPIHDRPRAAALLTDVSARASSCPHHAPGRDRRLVRARTSRRRRSLTGCAGGSS